MLFVCRVPANEFSSGGFVEATGWFDIDSLCAKARLVRVSYFAVDTALVNCSRRLAQSAGLRRQLLTAQQQKCRHPNIAQQEKFAVHRYDHKARSKRMHMAFALRPYTGPALYFVERLHTMPELSAKKPSDHLAGGSS